MDVLSQIEASYRARSARRFEAVPAAGFTLFIDRPNNEPGASFAMLDLDVPGSTSSEFGAVMAELRRAFAALSRVPCLKFFDALAPQLPSRLEAGGYGEIQREPVMICETAARMPLLQHPGVQIDVLSADAPTEAIRANLEVNELGFDPAARLPSAEDAERFRPLLERSRAITVRYEGQPVSAGMLDSSIPGISELAGVATLSEFRRRGFATALALMALQVAFERDDRQVFLRAKTEDAARVYERAGFYRIGALLTYLEAGSGTT
jgi:ribosomal protein S18 acetylase RimI-like enzyme